MSMKDYFFSTVCVSIIENKTFSVVNSCSGVYIRSKFDKNSTGIIVSSVSVLKDFSNKNYEIFDGYSLASCNEDSINNETISWTRVKIKKIISVGSSSKSILPLMRSGFNFIPNKICLENLSVLVPDYPFFPSFEYNSANDLSFHPDSIQIKGTPFGTVNPALFIDYTLFGHISYISSDKLAFSDIKYLDGIEGSIVLNLDKKAIGLVLGALRKNNGEGEVIVILSLKIFMEILLKINSIEFPITNILSPEKIKNNSQGIVYISVENINNQKNWGSGMLISSDCIVTNRHVVPTGFKQIFAHFQNNMVTECTYFGSPILELDLLFLYLKQPMKVIEPIKFSEEDISAGEEVYTVGFGLFSPLINAMSIVPLIAKGNITKIFKSEFTNNSTHKQNVLLITSSCCWNGSSGGALINRHGKVLGMITSNGRVNNRSEIIPQIGFIIPSNIIKLALNFVKEGKKSIEMNKTTRKIWQLTPTHRMKYTNEKPKL